jgi:hypothetical protein
VKAAITVILVVFADVPPSAGVIPAGRRCGFPAEAHQAFPVPAPLAPSRQVRRPIPTGERRMWDHDSGSGSTWVACDIVGRHYSSGGHDAAGAMAPAGQLGAEAAVRIVEAACHGLEPRSIRRILLIFLRLLLGCHTGSVSVCGFGGRGLLATRLVPF